MFLEHLIQLRYKINTIVVPSNAAGSLQDLSLKLMLEDLGFHSVISLNEFERLNLQGGNIQGLPFLGEHGDLYIQTKLAWLIDIAGVKILCAADSNNLDHTVYEHVHQYIGDIDVLFIGMECVGAPLSWIYQSVMLTQLTRKMDQDRRLNGSDFNKAKMIVDLFNCKQVYIYALGQEPWLNYVMSLDYKLDSAPIVEADKLVEYCKERGILSKRLFGSDVINRYVNTLLSYDPKFGSEKR